MSSQRERSLLFYYLELYHSTHCFEKLPKIVADSLVELASANLAFLKLMPLLLSADNILFYRLINSYLWYILPCHTLRNG